MSPQPFLNEKKSKLFNDENFHGKKNKLKIHSFFISNERRSEFFKDFFTTLIIDILTKKKKKNS